MCQIITGHTTVANLPPITDDMREDIIRALKLALDHAKTKKDARAFNAAKLVMEAEQTELPF